MNADTTTLIAQLRTVLELTNTEIQIAEVRVAQARTDAVREELTKNAEHGRIRAVAIEDAIRDLGGFPDVVGPILGRVAAVVKAFTEQAEPFNEALLGDLALENQLLDRARYIKALAVAAQEPDLDALASRLITAHTATVQWLTTVLAEDALGGPAALRRTPAQAASGVVVKLVQLPALWSARGVDRVVAALRGARPAVEDVLSRTGDISQVLGKTLSASRDAALETAEKVSRREGAGEVADALHSLRSTIGVLDPDELPIGEYDALNVNDAVAAIKDLDEPADIRAVIAYEEFHKNRSRVVSAAQTRLAALAQDIVGIS